MPMAMARKTWMRPPAVMELMDPRSQSTTKISANVDTTYLHGWETRPSTRRSYLSSDSPVRIATDKMRRAAMMNSLRLVA
jgi:hypothetical protein